MRGEAAIVRARGAKALGALALIAAACNGQFRFDDPAPLASDGGSGETDAARRCTANAECAAIPGLVCDVATGRCVACRGDSDCTSNDRKRCDPDRFTCVRCLRTDDCSDNQRCDLTTHRCLDTCDDFDDPCPLAGYTCDRARRLCVECSSSVNCEGSAPRTTCDVPIGMCVECNGNARCSAPRPICDRTRGTCVGCSSSLDCAPGQACSAATSECVALP